MLILLLICLGMAISILVYLAYCLFTRPEEDSISESNELDKMSIENIGSFLAQELKGKSLNSQNDDFDDFDTVS